MSKRRQSLSYGSFLTIRNPPSGISTWGMWYQDFHAPTTWTATRIQTRFATDRHLEEEMTWGRRISLRFYGRECSHSRHGVKAIVVDLISAVFLGILAKVPRVTDPYQNLVAETSRLFSQCYIQSHIRNTTGPCRRTIWVT